MKDILRILDLMNKQAALGVEVGERRSLLDVVGIRGELAMHLRNEHGIYWDIKGHMKLFEGARKDLGESKTNFETLTKEIAGLISKLEEK